jgi:cleavage and polyadenylation specificity factor subunit 1
MQCYSELVAPTAVSHAIALPLLHPKANNLVVAKTSLVQIFQLKSISTEVSNDRTGGADGVEPDLADEAMDLELHRMEDTTKLSLICEYHLSGTVTALKRVKTLTTKSGGEALLIAFRDAKLSLVEWDPETFKLSTISVHYYEGEGLHSSPWSPELGAARTVLTVDPDSRCAALKFGQRQLAILPFRQANDDFAEDYDPEFDEPIEKMKVESQKKGDENGAVAETPYKASFALSLTALDPTLTHPVHLAFLHGFRDPTFGILYSFKSASTALLYERRDVLSYTVFNLDIEQRASTSILSVTNLPNDLHEVVALPPPVGGALLIGNNELVHIDQDGKVNALAVNEFARVVSKFAMVDASELDLRLEHCTVQQIGDNGDMLLALNSGDLAVISFTLEGRSVSGIKVHKVTPDRGGTILPTGASCISVLSRSRLFLGSQDSDSVIVGWSSTQKSSNLTRRRSHAEMSDEEEDLELDGAGVDDDDEDDIYGADDSAKEQRQDVRQDAIDAADYVFRIHDKLPNFAPIGPMTLGVPSAPDTAGSSKLSSNPVAELEMVYPCGRAAAGGLAILQREIDPVVVSNPTISKTKAIWGVRPVYDLTASADFHEYVVAVHASDDDDDEDRSVLYKITSDGLESCDKEEFEPDAGATIDMGTLSGAKRILQVLKDNVRVYDERKYRSISLHKRKEQHILPSTRASTKTRVEARTSIVPWLVVNPMPCISLDMETWSTQQNGRASKLYMCHIAQMQYSYLRFLIYRFFVLFACVLSPTPCHSIYSNHH